MLPNKSIYQIKTMTTPKSKTKPAKTPLNESVAAKPAIAEFAGLPSPLEIAMIAASLTGSRYVPNYGVFAPSIFTNRAMELWLSARDTLFWADIEGKAEQQEQILRGVKNDVFGFFKPTDKFPIALDELLKKALPQKANRPGELATLFKEYLKRRIFEQNVFGKKKIEDPTEGEINAAYDKMKTLPDKHAAGITALHFRTWFEAGVSEARHVAGLKSARKKKKDTKVDG